MVTTQKTLDLIKSQSITTVATQITMGFSTNTTPAGVGDTTLTDEIERNLFDLKTLDVPNSKLEVESDLLLSQGNSETITQIGTFDAITTGNMGTIENLPVSVDKDDTFKLRVGLRINVSVTNTS